MKSLDSVPSLDRKLFQNIFYCTYFPLEDAIFPQRKDGQIFPRSWLSLLYIYTVVDISESLATVV